MNYFSTYRAWIKPRWSPPAWLFGPVWTVLYIGIALSFGTVFYLVARGELSALLALPFALNLLFNAVFTYIQFRLRNNLLASLDIVLVFVTLVWALIGIYPALAWVALINIPYLLWVTFASALQFTVTYLNRGQQTVVE